MQDAVGGEAVALLVAPHAAKFGRLPAPAVARPGFAVVITNVKTVVEGVAPGEFPAVVVRHRGVASGAAAVVVRYGLWGGVAVGAVFGQPGVVVAVVVARAHAAYAVGALVGADGAAVAHDFWRQADGAAVRVDFGRGAAFVRIDFADAPAAVFFPGVDADLAELGVVVGDGDAVRACAGGDDVAVHLRPAVVLEVLGENAVGMVRERIEVALRARFVHALQKFLRADVTAIGAAVADGHAACQHVRLRVGGVRRFIHQLEQAGVMLRVRVGIRPAVAPEFVARLVPEFVIVDALRAVALDRFTEEAGEIGVVLRFGRVRARPVALLRQFLLLRGGQVADVARPVGRAHDLHQHFHAVFLRQPDRIIDIAPVVAAVVLRLHLVPAGGDAHPFHAERGGARVTFLNRGAVVARPARVERLHADAIGAAERLAADDEIHRRLLVVRAGVFFRVVAVGQRAARRIVTGQRQRALGIVDDRARLAGKVGEFGGV